MVAIICLGFTAEEALAVTKNTPQYAEKLGCDPVEVKFTPDYDGRTICVHFGDQESDSNIGLFMALSCGEMTKDRRNDIMLFDKASKEVTKSINDAFFQMEYSCQSLDLAYRVS